MSPDKNLPAQGPVTTRGRAGLSTELSPGAGTEEALGGGGPGGDSPQSFSLLLLPRSCSIDPFLCSGISLLWFMLLSDNCVYIYISFYLEARIALGKHTVTHNTQQLNFFSFIFIPSRELSKTLAADTAKSLQLCPTLCDPIHASPLGPTVPGILQARILEWVAISFSNA